MMEIKVPHIQYLSRREAAEYTFQHYGTAGISSRTLARLACAGGGPVFHKIGNKRVGYTVEALDAWMTERISRARRSTSEAA
jgi:hypothetical protein